jgi:Protein of unknown function (DUF4239)
VGSIPASPTIYNPVTLSHLTFKEADRGVNMLNTIDDVVLVILIVTFSLLFMVALNHFWPPAKRSPHNDVIGWQLSILGTTYAVIIGFMLYTVWTNFGLAGVNANAESNSIQNVYHLAEGLPDPQRSELKDAARSYADTVVQQDWPAMSHSVSPSLKSRGVATRMWQILMSVKAASPNEILAEDHALSELSAVVAYRKMRETESSSTLPTVLWLVLVVGGGLTIMSSCTFGSSNHWLHALQVFAFSLLISMVLAAVADIDRPFQGSVHVSDSSFRRAQINMK